MRRRVGSRFVRTCSSPSASCTRAWRGSKARHLMSLLDTFRSLPTGRLKLGTLPQWMSGSKFRLPSGLVSRRSPELLPAVVTVALFMAAGVQMAIPSTVDLPQETSMAPRPLPAAFVPAAREYPVVLAKPIFAPDRAPVILQAQTAGNLG